MIIVFHIIVLEEFLVAIRDGDDLRVNEGGILLLLVVSK